jgi:hypothetical protein
LDNVGNYVRWAGSLVLALGFICFKPTLAAALGTRQPWSVLAYFQAGAGIALVLCNVAGANTAANVAAVASGLIFGPALAIVAGRRLGWLVPRTLTVPWRAADGSSAVSALDATKQQRLLRPAAPISLVVVMSLSSRMPTVIRGELCGRLERVLQPVQTVGLERRSPP